MTQPPTMPEPPAAFTATQRQRLHELGARTGVADETFADAATRDESFRRLEVELVGDGRAGDASRSRCARRSPRAVWSRS